MNKSDITCCIFNFKHDMNSLRWYNLLKDKWETYIIDMFYKENPNYQSVFLDFNNTHIIKEGNIFFGGACNVARKIAKANNSKYILNISCDIEIDDENASKFVSVVEDAITNDNIGCYYFSLKDGGSSFGDIHPNGWNDIYYNQNSGGYRRLPHLAEDWMMLSRRELWDEAYNNLTISNNKYGWEIGTIISELSIYRGFINVIEDRVKVFHPLGSNYNQGEASAEGAMYYEEFSQKYPKYNVIDRFGYHHYFHKDLTDKDKYIVCACVKNEDRYITEWVEHYKKLGFDKIILADNNEDNTILPNILKVYLDEGFVEIFDCHDIVSLQLPVYACLANEKNYKCLACFDADEFLEISPLYRDVKEFLNDTNGDCVLVNWLMYGPDGQIVETEGNVQERFKNPVYPISLFKENMFFKPIIKDSCPQGSFTSSHEIIFDGEEGVYDFGGYCTGKTAFQVSYPVRYKKAWLKHYYTKSFNEYLEKIRRGWPDYNDISRLSNMSHYFLMDSSDDLSLIKFSEGIFSKQEKSWVWDILQEYDVIVYHCANKNYYTYLYHLGKSMTMVTGHTFIVDEDTDDNIYNTLFEIAIKTGNRIIASKDNSDIHWDLYERYTNGLNTTYYVITVS